MPMACTVQAVARKAVCSPQLTAQLPCSLLGPAPLNDDECIDLAVLLLYVHHITTPFCFLTEAEQLSMRVALLAIHPFRVGYPTWRAT